ncbi:DNA polymerase III subunit delta [Geminocystis sp. CENA526]|uniref:DNA polymerase III subunit delta n=1 Tax=Geminocystis sp. CENA526 TaxID=1355871 RepID=UPI003D70138C
MPIYLYWGEDDFAMSQAISTLKQDTLDRDWIQFNFDKLAGDKEDSILSALMQVMTPPFGGGDRVVWLFETNICQSCSEELLSQLQNTIPQIPDTTHFLLTTSKKPDARIKSTKLITKYAKVVEFALISPWQTEILIKKVEEVAQEKQVKLTPSAIKILASCVGNDSRLLWQELEKLAIYQGNNSAPIEEETVKSLVNVSTQNSLQLAQAILDRNIPLALTLVQDLITLNEPALRIVATLVGQFRTWAIVKTMIESGEKDEKKIAESADLGNPKRIYFLRQEIKARSSQQLLSSLPILLELETSLKLGADPLNALETKVIELCNV